MTDNIEISIKGIPATLIFDKRTAELFPYNLNAILKRYPDSFTEYSAYFRPPTLAYCGYYIHCHDANISADISFDDFCEWADSARKNQEGRCLLNLINELYQKHVEA